MDVDMTDNANSIDSSKQSYEDKFQHTIAGSDYDTVGYPTAKKTTKKSPKKTTKKS